MAHITLDLCEPREIGNKPRNAYKTTRRNQPVHVIRTQKLVASGAISFAGEKPEQSGHLNADQAT